MKCFKTYDVRGIVGEELNQDIAFKIGAALAKVTSADTASVGADGRESSPSLKDALINGLRSQGVTVYDIGLSGTEEVYFATMHLKTDLGIEVTASHNPIEYNGIKFVGSEAKPFTDNQFQDVKKLAVEMPSKGIRSGKRVAYDILPAFCDHLLTYLDVTCLKQKAFKIVTNAGNGVAGHVIDALEARFKELGGSLEFIKIMHQPDHTFPNGIPNPLLPEGRKFTSDAIIESGADIGIAWDGDFDRCFFFDHKGQFIEGYYIVGLLARAFLQKFPNAKVIHDPRLLWNTQDIVQESNGVAVKSKTGHTYIKHKMREVDAVYGGEMSAHHYFKGFGYCDSGMIPWLLVVELLVKSQNRLADIVSEMERKYPVSGEINFEVNDTANCLIRLETYFQAEAKEVEKLDGLSMSFEQWRFNIRASNTEPLLRLNVEAKGDAALVTDKVNLIKKLIQT